MHICKDSAKFNSEFSATTLSHALRFRQKRRVIENFEYLGEFEEYFRKCWLYCVFYILVCSSEYYHSEYLDIKIFDQDSAEPNLV